tara:strand:+ start:3579 stop:3749 length:171 start_codon:yes stop_codon:yes gene_type:complete
LRICHHEALKHGNITIDLKLMMKDLPILASCVMVNGAQAKSNTKKPTMTTTQLRQR